MKLYFDPNHKWCLTMEDDNDPKKKHWIAVPPTNEDRIDIIFEKELKKNGYQFDFKGIIIRIRKGTPTAELIE